MYFCAFYQDEIGVAMNYFNRFLLKTMCLITIFSFVFFLGCKNDIVDDPIEENPQTDVPEEVSKTYLEINNQSQFDVNVYFTAPSEDSLWVKVPTGHIVKKEISPSQTEEGDCVYIEYKYVVGNVTIPYFDINTDDCIKKLPIYENKVNTIKLSKISSFGAEKAYVIIENESSDPVYFTNKSDYTFCPYSSEDDKWINNGDNKSAVYIFPPYEDKNVNNINKDKIDFKDYYIGNGLNNKKIDVVSELEKGFIYTIKNRKDNISLFCVTPVNEFLQNKVWKNSLSKTYGKDLVAGCIAPRESQEDGYMLFGSLSASSINDSIEGNVPYYAFMNTNGEVTNEYSLNFKDSPKSTVFYHCIEKNGIWVAVGKNRYEDNSDSLFIIGEQNGRSFYQKIPSPAKDSEQDLLDGNSAKSDYKSCGITHVENNTFCVLLGYEDDENGSKVAGFELLEVTIDSSNEVKNTIVYKTSEEVKGNAVIPCSVLYNNGKYIVLSQNTSLEESTISIIEKNSDTFEFKKNIILGYFSLNKMKIYSGDIFLSGSYVDEVSGRDIATFGKIKIDDIDNLSTNVDTSNFKMFTGSNNSLNSNFDDFVVDEKKENIILGGFSCADYDYQDRKQYGIVTKNAVPFVVSYNLDKNKTNWENEYTDQKGYVVYSVEKSSINSLFLDLWNPSTRHSYIVSTGLLGEIPEKIKYTLGQGSSIKEVKGAEITVKFYENSNSQTAYAQDVFQLGKEYTLEDLKKYEPSNVCKVTGWYVLDEYGSNANRNLSMFNTAINTISRLVAILGTSSVPNDKIEDTSVEDDTIVKGEELTFPVIFTDYNITEINLYPKYECSIHYDENYHWNVCTCGKKTENKTKHIFSNWQKLNGKDIKKCSLCDFTITADENTHIIYSVYDLQNIKNNNTTATTFELANDIDGGGQTWTPIDTFYGTLVGNGFSIKNFTINHESSLDNNTAYCGFVYKNRGTIKNIFFKNITLDAYFEYQTSDWRYVNVGTVVAANYGSINNGHLVNVSVNSNLIHKKDKSNDDVRQINIVGGVVGKNYETINYCSIKQSYISVSTDSKYNWCDTSAWAGGICGENTKDCTNLLSMNTSVSTSTKGGYNWWMGNDGHLKCYAGCVFGIIKGSGNNFNIISYENRLPQTYIYANSCDNTEQIHKKGYIYGVNEHKVTDAYSITDSSDLNSYSSTINSWECWSVADNSIENYLDFN